MPEPSALPDLTSTVNHTLERLRVGMAGRIHPSILSTASVEYTTGKLLLQLHADILADRLPPETVTERARVDFAHPSSPFQHWKAKHQESWWLRPFVRRWPVALVHQIRIVELEVNLERYRTYPEANFEPAPAHFGYPVLWSNYTTNIHEC
jgi:hypothetical protein